MGVEARGRGRGRVKRKEVEIEDGWTVVTHGLANLSLGKGKSKSRLGNNGELVAASSLPTDVVQGLTLEKLLDDFRKLQERWEDTTVAKQVQELLSKAQFNVDSAVCIGIGSLSRDWAHRWRSLWQLVLFIDVVGHCNKSKSGSGGELEVMKYAQDPAFTSLDVTFLEELGVEVTETGIEEHIEEASFVYSPFVDWYLLLPLFLNEKDPLLYVGNEILDDYTPYGQSPEKRERLEECNGLGKKFLSGKEMVKLSEFGCHANALNGMVVYWRRGSDVEKQKEEQSK